MHEIAALAGYTIDASTGQDPTNKARALRRLTTVKADIVSRYGGKWKAQYREGWLPLSAPYNTGTALFTQNSVTVTGTNTVWTTSMKGQKIQGGDSAYYKIASVQSPTALTLTHPYQGSTTTSTQTYQIWQDEYRLYPDVLAVAGFVNYFLPSRMTESWPTNMKDSFPFPTSQEEPEIYTVLQRDGVFGTQINSGTVSITQNSNLVEGSGTTWLSGVQAIEPGWQITINSVTYTVRRVNSDTEIELYQLVTSTTNSGLAYIALAKNCLIIRFNNPSTQRIVQYWYYAKDAPPLNDNDEDWVMELYPEVILNGAVLKDYLDKNEVARAGLSKQAYEDAIKNMKVADEGAYTGIRTLGIYVPPEARL